MIVAKNSIQEDREKEKEKKVAKKGQTLGFPASKRQEREKFEVKL